MTSTTQFPRRPMLMACLTVTFLLSCGPGRARAVDSLDDLTGPWQLLVDDYPVAAKTNVVRTYHAFDKYGSNPVLTATTAWEQLVNIYGTVLPNETRTGYRMWYQNYLTNDPCAATSRQLYATSTNGIDWVKPALYQNGWCGSSNNNMYFPGFMTSVMYTPGDPDPAKRYKLMNFVGGGWSAAWSSNGVNVVSAPTNPVAGGSDSGQFCWDPHTQQYLGYVKDNWTDANGLKRRAVALTASANFTNWSTPSLILWPDAVDDRWSLNVTQRTHFYGVSAFPYESMYLGFLWIHRATNLFSNPPGLYEGYQVGPIFVELVSSHDGIHWTREEGNRPPLLPLGGAGTWDQGMIFTARAPLVEGNTVKIWYGGWKNVHDTSLNAQAVSIGLATLRKDGFASLDAGATAGSVLTKPLLGANGPLLVNYQTTNSGWLKVEVLDVNSNVLSGYSAADCVALTGNSITQAVTWSAHTALPPGPSPLRLRFVLQNASVYSFMAGASAEPAEAPAITQQPASRAVPAGGVATFNVLATGTPLPAYQWRKGQVDLSDGGRYSGCATATLMISDVVSNDAASYRCVVTNAHGSVTSNPAILTVATNAIGGVTLKAIPTLSGDAINEGRALAPDGKWVVGVSGSRGFLFQTVTSNLFNVRSADNYQSSVITGVGYRTQGAQQELVMCGLASNWFTAFMTTNGTGFANKVQISGGTIKVPVVPTANGLAGTASNVFYAGWSDNNSSDYQEYVGTFSGAWPMTPQWDVKGIPKPTPAGINAISATGRAIGWRGSPKTNYAMDRTGTGATAWFFNGLDGTTTGEALAVSGDGTMIFGQSPVLGGRPGNWAYQKVVAWTVPGPAAQLSIAELPTFPDTDGSTGSASAPYGCTTDGKFAVGTAYRGLERAVLWDLRDPNPTRWSILDLTAVADANGGLNIFTRLVRAYSVAFNPSGNLVITGYGLDSSGNKRAFILSVPPPTAPAITLSGSYPAGFSFTFTSLGNRNLTNYLEFTTNLNPPHTWNTIASAPCNGELTVLSDPSPASAQRFYRIRTQ